MHELISFAKSPYDMIAYDNKMKYNWPENHPQAQVQPQEGDGQGISDTSTQPGTLYVTWVHVALVVCVWGGGAGGVGWGWVGEWLSRRGSHGAILIGEVNVR